MFDCIVCFRTPASVEFQAVKWPCEKPWSPDVRRSACGFYNSISLAASPWHWSGLSNIRPEDMKEKKKNTCNSTIGYTCTPFWYTHNLHLLLLSFIKWPCIRTVCILYVNTYGDYSRSRQYYMILVNSVFAITDKSQNIYTFIQSQTEITLKWCFFSENIHVCFLHLVNINLSLNSHQLQVCV